MCIEKVQCTFLILRPGGFVDKHLLDLFLKIQLHLLMRQTDLLLLVVGKHLSVRIFPLAFSAGTTGVAQSEHSIELNNCLLFQSL